MVTMRSRLAAAPPSLASWIRAFCMIPTSVRPSGVMANPSIPLLAVRPTVLPLISVVPMGLRLGTKNDSGNWKERILQAGEPVELINVRAVLIGDKDAAQIVGKAHALCVQPGVSRGRPSFA